MEFHENALYALINVLQECSKPLKQQIYQLGVSSPFIKFTKDLFEFEVEILRNEKDLLIFADYRVEWNPEYSNSKIMNSNKDLTLGEMQQ